MMSNLSTVKTFLLDMDGTFYLGDKLIPGSLEFIDAVKRTGRDFLFMTNNSSRNANYYVQKLARLGLAVGPEKVLTSTQATAICCRDRFGDRRAFVLGNEYMQRELEAGGISIDQRNPAYVIVGYDTTLDYQKMTAACDFVRAGLPYVASHPDYNCPTETGFAPDIGAIMAFIEASTGRKADWIIGKPHRGIVDAALSRTGCAPSELAMVGDRLYTDIATGKNHGMVSILVLSGETTDAMLCASDIKPDLVVDRLENIINML